MDLKITYVARDWRKALEIVFFARAPLLFWLYKYKLQVVVLVSAFVMGSIFWSVYCLLLMHAAPCLSICKSGARTLRCPMESVPLLGIIN